MHRGQELVPVSKVVLSELARSIAQRLQQFGDSRIFRLKTSVGSGHSDLGQPRADWILAGKKRRASGSAALLAVIVGERYPFIADTVDVRGAVPHLPPAIVADVPPADIISPQDENIWSYCVC